MCQRHVATFLSFDGIGWWRQFTTTTNTHKRAFNYLNYLNTDFVGAVSHFLLFPICTSINARTDKARAKKSVRKMVRRKTKLPYLSRWLWEWVEEERNALEQFGIRRLSYRPSFIFFKFPILVFTIHAHLMPMDCESKKNKESGIIHGTFLPRDKKTRTIKWWHHWICRRPRFWIGGGKCVAGVNGWTGNWAFIPGVPLLSSVGWFGTKGSTKGMDNITMVVCRVVKLLAAFVVGIIVPQRFSTAFFFFWFFHPCIRLHQLVAWLANLSTRTQFGLG